ncbi:MAG: hypothetical protein LBJ84_00565, partial [Oscillospiraceae bacterium]|nr:hypothetical protein [Oscillospiraceae bacterium]
MQKTKHNYHSTWTMIVSALLALAIALSIVTIAPLSAQAAEMLDSPATGSIDQRIESLRGLMAQHNNFFTVNGKSCTHGKYDACDNCKLEKVMRAWGFNLQQSDTSVYDSWTCVSFAHFALWYIFNHQRILMSRVSSTPGLTVINDLKSAKKGDMLVWLDSNGNIRHYAMFLSYDGAKSLRVFDSNSGNKDKDGVGNFSYDRQITWATYGNPTKIYRSNDYDKISGY